MQRSEQINELVIALAKAQTEFGPVFKETENPFYHSKYADLASIVKATQPALNRNGLTIVQGVACTVETLTVAIETMIAHTSGQWISETLHLPGTQKDRFDAQSVGSAVTYGRRYGWQAMTGVCADFDDDGNSASDANGKHADSGSVSQAKAVAVEKVKAAGGPSKTVLVTELPGGWLKIHGDGLDTMLTVMGEPTKNDLDLSFKGAPNGWVMPHKSSFTLEDLCKAQGIGYQYTAAPEQVSAMPVATPGAYAPIPAPGMKVIGDTKERSGTKNGKPWGMLTVSYGGVDHICWDKKVWPLLLVSKGKLALLETVPSFDGKKSPTITGILRIGDVLYERDKEGNPKAVNFG